MRPTVRPACGQDEETKKDKENNIAANWLFAQTTHVVGYKLILHMG